MLVKLFAVVSMFEGRECVLKELGQLVNVSVLMKRRFVLAVSIAQSKELRREAKLQRPGRCHV